jgi:predicted dehydrogenase
LRSGDHPDQYDDVTNISTLADCPPIDFIIISNPTALHYDALKKVAALQKPLFIEKPPFHTLKDATEGLSIVTEHHLVTYTAFNLRFLDCLLHLKNNLNLDKVQEVNVYCGSYLPKWREGVDYKKNYSAIPEMGGGVHLDLIHELDYVLWIFGKPKQVQSVLRSQSKIDIDAIDYANYVLTYDSFAITIVLNYYRRDSKRNCEIILEDATWNVDLLKNKITDFASNTVVFESLQVPQDTYKKQMEYFCNSLANKETPFNSLAESVTTLKIALS